MSKYLPYGFLNEEKFEKFIIDDFTFLKDNISIRSVKYKNIKIIKMISFLIRDNNWNNYQPKIIKSKIQKNNKEIQIIFDIEFSDKNQKMITQNKYIFNNNSIKLISVGKFLTNFVTNRAGFNILLPLKNICGQKINIISTDSKNTTSTFPQIISPDQPFINIKELSHTILDIDINYKFKGIKFEMEDQRNWGDASYKVYSGSLLDPFPIKINKDKKFYQEILISFTKNSNNNVIIKQSDIKNIIKIKNNTDIIGPKIGVKLDNLINLEFNKKINFLNYNHILIEFDLLDNNIKLKFGKFSKFYKNLNINIKIFSIFLVDHKKSNKEIFSQIKKLQDSVNEKINFEYILICPKIYLKSFQPAGQWPKVPLLYKYYNSLKLNYPNSKIVAGMVTNFTELNRKKPNGKFDIISHSFTPIVHDASDYALMETPYTIKYIIDSIKRFSNKSKIHIGPICIGMHHNPYGEKLIDNNNNYRLELTNNDSRHDSLLSFVWSVGMYRELVNQKINLLTFNSLFGFHGILDNYFNQRILYLFNKIILSFSNKKIINTVHNNKFFSIGINENSILKILISNNTKFNQCLNFCDDFIISSSYINEKNFHNILNNINSFFILQKSSNELSFHPYETKYLEIKKK